MPPITGFLRNAYKARVWKSSVCLTTAAAPSHVTQQRLISTSAATVHSKRLEGKVAIITGGASGIGRASAELFVSHGAKVVIADIQDELGSKVAESLGEEGSAHYMHCDVRKEAAVSSTVDFCVSKYGHLDIMYNNAGTAGPLVPSITQLEADDFENLLAVNLKGTVFGTKHAARVMIPAQRGGSIICTASIAGVMGGLAPHAYSISKHAIIGMTKIVAGELGRYGIRVNCVSPYGIATPLAVSTFTSVTPSLTKESIAKALDDYSGFQDAHFEPTDVAMAALFLASEDARFISGQNLVVDAAYTVTKVFNPFKDDKGESNKCPWYKPSAGTKV